MKRNIVVLAFLLVLAAAAALAQTPSNSQSNTQKNVAGSTSGNAIPTNAAPAVDQSSTANSGIIASGVTDSATLKGQIESAYQAEPTLTGSNIQVNVSDMTIELSGSVPTGKEKITAKRIAQSYAGNRKVVDKMTVSGRGNAVPTLGPPGEASPK